MTSPKRAASNTSSASNSSTSSPPASHHDHNNPTLCSAYSPAAKASEDWTTIEDRTERRRIQNRIAQRAYRQKLKERLHHLERKAASSSGRSPTPEREPELLYAPAHSSRISQSSMSNTSSSTRPEEYDAYSQKTWSSPDQSAYQLPFDESALSRPSHGYTSGYSAMGGNSMFDAISEEPYYGNPGLAYTYTYPEMDTFSESVSNSGPSGYGAYGSGYPEVGFDGL